jgi:hypothetical protein
VPTDINHYLFLFFLPSLFSLTKIQLTYFMKKKRMQVTYFGKLLSTLCNQQKTKLGEKYETECLEDYLFFVFLFRINLLFEVL